MDDLTSKYLKRIRSYFIVIGVLGYLFMFTVGVMFFLMDVATIFFFKIFLFILLLIIPTIYLVTGLIIKIKNKFIWILALILSILPIIHAIPSLIRSLYRLPFSIIFMLTYSPVLWEILFGIILLIHILKPEVRKYYF